MTGLNAQKWDGMGWVLIGSLNAPLLKSTCGANHTSDGCVVGLDGMDGSLGRVQSRAPYGAKNRNRHTAQNCFQVAHFDLGLQIYKVANDDLPLLETFCQWRLSILSPDPIHTDPPPFSFNDISFSPLTVQLHQKLLRTYYYYKNQIFALSTKMQNYW